MFIDWLCFGLLEIDIEEDQKPQTKKLTTKKGKTPLSDRFANARCKPIDYSKLLGSGDENNPTGGTGNKFHNAGF